MITKSEFEELYNPNITKIKYDNILKKIDERFVEICKKFLTKTNRNAWFDYDTGYINREGTNTFEPNKYKEYIPIMGEYISPPCGYDLSIPTRWLWEPDWETELRAEVQKNKIEKTRQKIQRKKKEAVKNQKIKSLQNSIRTKLTKEEFSIIKWK